MGKSLQYAIDYSASFKVEPPMEKRLTQDGIKELAKALGVDERVLKGETSTPEVTNYPRRPASGPKK